MDLSATTSQWTTAALCGAALLAVAGRMLSSALGAMFQFRRNTQSSLLLQEQQEKELAITLQHTFTDAALLDRNPSWQTVRVVKVVRESADVRSFYMLDQYGEPLCGFLPGQHLLVERPGGAVAQAEFRCYSLSDDPKAGYWRISVKRAGEHPTSVSRWLHDEIQEGDTLRVRGPSGSFFLKSCTARNAIFLCAGVGVTPMLPMLYEAICRPHGSIHFFAQFRDIDHAPFAERLLAFAQQNPMVRMRLWLSQFPQGVRGAETEIIQEGKLSVSDVCNDIDTLSESDVYLCGPEAWVQSLRIGLIEFGIPESNIFFELFHSNEIRSAAQEPAEGAEPAPRSSVHFRQSNRLAEYAANHPNLLSFANQTDVPLNSGCRTGACGSCAIRLLQGKVRYTRKPQYPLKSNEILPCVCVPDGNIVVDA